MTDTKIYSYEDETLTLEEIITVSKITRPGFSKSSENAAYKTTLTAEELALIGSQTTSGSTAVYIAVSIAYLLTFALVTVVLDWQIAVIASTLIATKMVMNRSETHQPRIHATCR